MKGKHIPYSPAELAWIEGHCTLPRKEAHAQFQEAFDRPDVPFELFKALCTRKGWKTGRTGRIEPGTPSWNKGKVWAEGEGGKHPNCRRTQFQPGVRQGVATKLYKPIGTERLSKDGYLERKIHDGLPLQSRWRAVHLVEWEGRHGPLPRGMCLKCLDGDRQNTDPANWTAIPRGALPFLNGHRGHDYEATADELRPAVLALAKLKHAKSRVVKRKRNSNPGGTT